MTSFLRQTKYLLYRNFLLKIRDRKTLFQELFLPCLFLVSIYAINLGIKPQIYNPVTYGEFQNYKLIDANGSVSFLPKVDGNKSWAFTPNTTSTQEVMDAIKTSLGDYAPSEFLAFASESEMVEDYRMQQDPSFSFGIVFSDTFPQDLTVVIRMPYEQMPPTSSGSEFASQVSCRVSAHSPDAAPGLVQGNCPANDYLFSGFAALQTILQNAISSMLTNQSLPLPDFSVRMFPKGMFVQASPVSRLISAFYYVLMYSVFIAVLLTYLVYEKEKKIKETMLMMGMYSAAFWVAWFITYTIIMFLVSLVIAILSKYAIQIVPKGNLLIIFLIMFLYGMSIISLAFMLSAFFDKALTAGALGSFATLLLSLVYIPLGLISGVDVVIKWLLSFFSPIALALAVDQAIALDEQGPGIQFDNFGLDGFPPYVAMLFIDTVLYLLLAIYFDNVVPGSYGQHKPPWFCCMPSFWCNPSGKSDPDIEVDLDVGGVNQEDIELVPPEMRDRAHIRIRNLCKTFKGGRKKPDVLAVKGMTLDIYEGQITCLLGHNGAGKTTLINTLTGLITADSGQATIYGHSIRDPIQMQQIRSMMGVCSQDNTLIDALSPWEHLKFYAGMKGVPSDDIDAEVEKVLKQCQLDESASTKAKDLSGGQKRKLCVGIALIGNPKILFLDEPSSGMDPYSRRQLWSLLKSQRQGRITVLTTHFMDEADILADRKAIMSQGSLRCYGSSLFLKTRFGIGYHLGMVVEQDVLVHRITDLVMTYVPNGTMSRSHGMELAYTLPLQDANKFPDLFRGLEATGGSDGGTVAEQLGIQTYGVSMTTLEEVFLKLSDEEQDDKEEEIPENISDLTPINRTDSSDNNTLPRGESLSLGVDHLLTKPLEPGKFQLKALCMVLSRQMIRNPEVYILRLLFPILYMVMSVVLSSVISFGTGQDSDPVSLTLDPKIYLESSSPSSLQTLTPLLYQDNLTGGEDITKLVDQFDRMGVTSDNIIDMSDLMSVAPHSMATTAVNLGTTNGTPNFLALYNDTAQHSLPILLSMLSNALVPLETPSHTVLNMTIANHPLPARAVEYGFNSGFFLVLFLAMSLNFLPLGFVTNVVKERQEKVNTQLRLSGITMANYWGSHLMIDAVQLYVITVVAVIIVAVANSSLATAGGMFMFIVFMIIFVPVQVVFSYCLVFLFKEYKTCQSFCPIFFFYVPMFLAAPVIVLDVIGSTAPAGILHLIFSIFYPPYAIFGALFYIDKTYQVASAFQILDQLSFGDYFAFDKLIVPTLLVVLVSYVWVFLLLRYLEITSTGGNWKDTFMCSQGKVGTVLQNNDSIPAEDSDVKAERDKVQEIFHQGIHPDKCVVATSGVRKEYTKSSGSCGRKNKGSSVNVAVRNLSLSVNEGEVMGLLGPNGAGKTTSINVIMADTKATRGQVQIAGYDITSSLSDAFRVMGFCPQHDPLYEHITMREHIEAYALIKGIHPDDVKAVAQHYMEALKVTEHADKRSQKLSGGTKRKLCFAMSMLGKPRIVCMDEPSTGMDPTSKRFVWNTIIDSFRDNRGAILTTHSMEEADAVCSRVAIMISGKLVCLGTTQHLKSKYGGGYVLEVKLNPGQAYYSMDHTSGQATQLLEEQLAVLDAKIKEVFPSAEVTETFGERVMYRIPSEAAILLSTVFAALEEGKETLNIEEYSFSQATLEQVFIEFAKMQRDEVEDEDRPSHQSSTRTVVTV